MTPEERDAEFEEDYRDAQAWLDHASDEGMNVLFAATLIVRAVERLRNAVEELKQ